MRSPEMHAHRGAMERGGHQDGESKSTNTLACREDLLYLNLQLMRLPRTIASILLSCTLGSLLWCADACVGTSGNSDEDCSCLLGGLLSGNRAESGSTIPLIPLAQSNDSCRCVCQTCTLAPAPYLLILCTSSSPVAEDCLTFRLPHFSKDILHPPRVA